MGEIYWIGEAEKYIERRVADIEILPNSVTLESGISNRHSRTKDDTINGNVYNWEPNYGFSVGEGDRMVIQKKEGLYDSRRGIFVRLPLHNIRQSVRDLGVKLSGFFEGKVNELILWNLTNAVKSAIDIQGACPGFRDLLFNELSRNGVDRYGGRMMAVRLEMNDGEFDEFSTEKMDVVELGKRYLSVSH